MLIYGVYFPLQIVLEKSLESIFFVSTIILKISLNSRDQLPSIRIAFRRNSQHCRRLAAWFSTRCQRCHPTRCMRWRWHFSLAASVPWFGLSMSGLTVGFHTVAFHTVAQGTIGGAE